MVNEKVGECDGQHPNDQSVIDSFIENNAEVQQLTN